MTPLLRIFGIGIFCWMTCASRSRRPCLKFNDSMNPSRRAVFPAFDLGNMKGFNFTTTFVNRNLPWTCQSCCSRQALRQVWRPRQPLRFSSKAELPRSKNKRKVILAAAGGATGVGAFAFTDDVRHSYQAVERTGRVVGTLAVCINEYASWSQ